MYKPLASLAVAVLLGGCASATKPVDPADALMARYAGDVPGASLLVLKDGKAIVSRSYGLANLEDHDETTPATNYRLASVSKQFTAAAILLLAESGRLHLDDPVRRWLPTLPETDSAVTLRQLLTHTGGLVDYEDLIPPDTTAQVSDNDVLRMLSATSKSYFAPGTSYRYSNSGYVLLGLVVERASGVSLPLYLQQHIFRPLHMDHTLMYMRGGPEVEHRAYGYSEEHGQWTRTDQSVTSATRGLLSNRNEPEPYRTALAIAQPYLQEP